MRLSDLNARFWAGLPLADGIFTSLYYLCPNDPSRKRGHVIHLDPPIVPRAYLESEWWSPAIAQAWKGQLPGPRWNRSGESIDHLTVSPSVAFACCHILIANGEVAP